MTFRRHSARWLALLALTLAGVAAVPPLPPTPSVFPVWNFISTNTVVALPAAVPITLEFDYQTNAVSADLTFLIHQSEDASLAVTNWPVAVTVPAANWMSNGLWIAPVQSSNYVFKVTFNVIPGVHFWYATASNFWTESFPSNTLTSPPPPLVITNLMIRRGTN